MRPSRSGPAPQGPAPGGPRAGRQWRHCWQAQQRVAAAREAAQGNVNPQLLLAALAEELAEVL